MTVAILCDVVASISFFSERFGSRPVYLQRTSFLSWYLVHLHTPCIAIECSVGHVSIFTNSGFLLPLSVLSVPRACAEVHAEILPSSCSFASLYVNSVRQINRAFSLSNSPIVPFLSPSFSSPLLKASFACADTFSSIPIMSASLRLAADGNTRPPRLQPSPSLPNLRCVH